jgi:hypothetical protein
LNADIFGTSKVQLERTGFNNIADPERHPDEGLAVFITPKIDADHHLSAQRLIHSLRIAASNGLSVFD